MGTPNRSVPVLLFSGLLASDAAGQSTAPPAATEILAKVEARFGDAAARKGLRTLVMSGSVEGLDCAAGDPAFASMKGRFEQFWLGAERAKLTMEFGAGSMSQGTTGAFSWSTDPGLGITIREGDEQAGARRVFDLGRRAEWTTMYASAELLDTEDLDGRKHFKLAMKPAAGVPDAWLIDAETFDLDAIDTTLPDPTGGEFPVRFLFADHRLVQGIRFPFSSTLKVGTVAITTRREKIEPNGAVKPEQVAPSAEVLAAVKDPSRRATAVPSDPSECNLEEIVAQPTLTIRLSIPADQVSRTLAIVIPEVMGAMTKVGGEMAGPPFSRYHSDDGKTIDLEAGIPVRKPVDGIGRVKASELPAGKTAVTWHVGPYTALPQSYARLKAWLASRSLAANGGYWEVYFTDPGIEPDPAKWRTRVFWPVK